MNAADMLQQVREDLNEASAAHWGDLEILRRLNRAQDRVGRIVTRSPGQWLVKSKDVTPVDSVITLPNDCAKPLYLESKSEGVPIPWLGSVAWRRVSRAAGASVPSFEVGLTREAYPLKDSIEVNESGFTTECTLWYEQRVPKLHTGTAGSGTGASALEFADDRELVFLDDYYNGVTVEVVDQTSSIVDIRSEITDFVASSRVATITGTPASGDTYGTVSVLPEETHELIVVWATVMCLQKPASTVDEKVIGYWREDLRTLRSDVENWLASRVPEGMNMLIGEEY